MVYDTQQELRETEADDGNHMVNKKKKKRKKNPTFFLLKFPNVATTIRIEKEKRLRTISNFSYLYLYTSNPIRQ
jgi:hypothetical protein